MGVKVYVELKKENKALPMYLLCITTSDRSLEIYLFGESYVHGNHLQIGYTNQSSLGETFGSVELTSSSCGQADVLFENKQFMVIDDLNQKVVAVDQVYKDKDTLKTMMANYAITNRFNFHTERCNAISYTLVCVSDDCDWKLRASSIGKSELFRIREFQDKHTCPLKEKVYSQRQATSRLINEIVKPKITNHKRKYTPKDIAKDIKNDFGMDVSYMVAWRAKEKVMIDLRGTMAESYNRLPVIKGFECCRPIVVIDGSHLKTPFNGTVVSASTLDGAGNILPLAYGVLDSENDKSWTCFFKRFRETYRVKENMCIVSDRHESINKVVFRIYSEVTHYASYTQGEFDELMLKVQKVEMRVAEYLDEAGRDRWARVYATVNRGWTMTSNIVECINKHLLAARELPIYDFLEEIEPSTEFGYAVNDGRRRFIINLSNKTCSCRMFQLDEIPCPHAWAVIKQKSLVVDDYCSDLFKPETVVKTYNIAVDPLPDQREWKIPKDILN
ncbi:uncharacterized protein LOC132643737 [Lycium barbarum]|uniref:uncharacterized protein LOC132643737 n=1 Tax=Lycium barbarum TaxID=112863 RepID=UPI00293EB1FC|nr:uncharacterized protein LOC132643737 [Lycium barbarum]